MEISTIIKIVLYSIYWLSTIVAIVLIYRYDKKRDNIDVGEQNVAMAYLIIIFVPIFNTIYCIGNIYDECKNKSKLIK